MITYTTPSFSLALDSTDNKVEALLSNSTLGYTIILHTQCEVEGNILEIEKKKPYRPIEIYWVTK